MRSTAKAATLFEDRSNDGFDAKLRRFACEVAKRHRGRPADSGALVLALRGYYRTWSIFEELPALDDRAIGIALAAYQYARSGRTSAAA